MSAFNELLEKANKWETKMRIPAGRVRSNWRTQMRDDVVGEKTSKPDETVNDNNNWSDIGGKKEQHAKDRKGGLNAKQMYDKNTKFSEPADSNRLPKSVNVGKSRVYPDYYDDDESVRPDPEESVPHKRLDERVRQTKQKVGSYDRRGQYNWNRNNTGFARRPTMNDPEGKNFKRNNLRTSSPGRGYLPEAQPRLNPNRLPKSVEESQMNKSALDGLQVLAKANVVQTMGGGTVNMQSPASVNAAKTATRVRSQNIRAAAPTVMPKSICGKKGNPKLVARKAAGPAPEFDMDAFNRENPVVDSSEFEPLDEKKLISRRIATGKKAPSMDAQANKMKSAKTKKAINIRREALLKSLDPTTLPKRGTTDRANYESAYNSWKPKPAPADWKPADKDTLKHLNSWARYGHKDSIHQLMDNGHWERERLGLNNPAARAQ